MPATVDRAEPGAERRNFVLYGHLRLGLEVRAAEAELGALAKQLSEIYPRSYPARFTVRLDRLGYIAVGQFQSALLTLLAAVGQYARPRFGLVLFSFAVIGLVLVTIGVYSVVSWTVTQQRHEISIRMALGASAGDVRSMVLAGTLRFVRMGVAAGIVLAWVVGRVLASQLWGVSGYDPVTLCGVTAVLIAVGLAAAYVPSLRATRVDPAVCLRWE
jgi:ABC-type antimicrobial peptide transport system permease subunit